MIHLNTGSVGPLDANQCAQPDLLPTFTRRVASVGASCKALNVGERKTAYGRACAQVNTINAMLSETLGMKESFQ